MTALPQDPEAFRRNFALLEADVTMRATERYMRSGRQFEGLGLAALCRAFRRATKAWAADWRNDSLRERWAFICAEFALRCERPPKERVKKELALIDEYEIAAQLRDPVRRARFAQWMDSVISPAIDPARRN